LGRPNARANRHKHHDYDNCLNNLVEIAHVKSVTSPAAPGITPGGIKVSYFPDIQERRNEPGR
jgi:hypothetical protein